MADTANSAIDQVMSMLGDVQPPASLTDLKEAIADGDSIDIAKKLFLVLLDQSIQYDVTDDRTLVPTTVDFTATEDPRVRDKLAYIYTYGITMYQRGYIPGDWLEGVILDKVASRVGMDGPAFDQWLQIPAVK